MALATERPSTRNGKGPLNRARPRQAAAASSLSKRRLQVPWVVAGVLLVVGCALAFGVASLRFSNGEQVLAVAKTVQPGQLVEAADLRAVTVPPAAGLVPVLAGAERTAVGQPAAVALVPGTLLTPADVGTTPAASAGTDVVALALHAGAYPPSLGAGDSVEVVPVPSSSSTAPLGLAGGGTKPAPATRAVVVAVDATAAETSSAAVVSLDVPAHEAAGVATLAAAGRAALVELPSGTGS